MNPTLAPRTAEETSPFRMALGDALDALPEKIRAHFDADRGSTRFKGTMTRVWRRRGLRGRLAGIPLWIAARLHTLFPETGENIPFELSHALELNRSGARSMTLSRTFHFPSNDRRFEGEIIFDPTRKTMIYHLGAARRLEVEMDVHTRNGEMRALSGRQWFHLLGLRLPIPHLLAGRALGREWQRSDGTLCVHVVISNLLLGEVCGFEGTFDRSSRGDAPP